MDMSLEYLLEAQGYIEQFVDVPFSDMFFEDTDVNAEAKGGAINAIKNAIKTLIKKIKEAIVDIKEWIHSKFMSREEKEKWKKMKAAINSDPELANSKIPIPEWEPYEKMYNDMIKTISDEQDKEEPDMQKINKKMAFFDKAIRDLGGKGKDAASRAVSVMTLKTAVDIADRNALCAKAINMMLNSELGVLEEIEKNIGQKQMQKYENKIRKYANNGFLHRMKVKLLYRQKATFKAVMNKQKKAILSYTNIDDNGKLKKGKSIISSGSIKKGAIMHPTYAFDIVGGAQGAMNINRAAREGRDFKKFITKSNTNIKKDLNSLKTFVGK